MYRNHHQQPVTSANGPMHAAWYGAYHHQTAQIPPPAAYCMQQEEQWAHHPPPHAAMFSNEYADFVSNQSIMQQQQQQAAAAATHHGSALIADSLASHHHHHQLGLNTHHQMVPSPSSDLSSPGLPNNNNNNNGPLSPSANIMPVITRPSPARSPFEWIKKHSYQSQPNPEIDQNSQPVPLDFTDTRDNVGKTRTKDKYRVVYTDHQRVELEKEFYYSRYITIRRKAELANNLGLSERQVKIWFQNRRAKERKQVKKRQDFTTTTNNPIRDNNNHVNITSASPQQLLHNSQPSQLAGLLPPTLI